MATYKQVLEALPSLSIKEQKEVRTRLDFLLSSKSNSQQVSEGWVFDWLTEGFIYEARRRGLVGNVSKQLYIQLKPKDYEANNEEVRLFLLQKAAGSFNAQEELVLGRVVARALADWLAFRTVPNFRTLIRNINNCVQAVEDSFPGYSESSMLDVLVRKYRKEVVDGT